MTKANSKAQSEGAAEQDRPVKVVADPHGHVDRTYANHVQIQMTPLDATIEFYEIDDLPEDRVMKHADYVEVSLRPKLRVVLSHDVFKNLANVMKSVADRHSVSLGKEKSDAGE